MEPSKLKEQRDRFLAFSFATSDLLLEVSPEGKITYITGATKGHTGVDEDYYIGKNWLEIFDQTDQTTLIGLLTRAKPGKRCGPVLVGLNSDLGINKQVILSGIKVPEHDSFYITLGFSNMLMHKIGSQTRQAEDTRLLGKDEFMQAAQEVLSMAKSLDQKAELTMLDLADTNEVSKRLGEKKYQELKDDLAELLRAQSIDGETAAEIGDGKFTLIHDETLTAEAIREKVTALSQQKDPTGDGFEFRAKTVETDLNDLNERETSRALFYTMAEFEKKGTDLTIETLGSSFQAYMTANAHKMAEFKGIINNTLFTLHFQPIVNLENGEASHYEMLARFKDGTPPFEWICFAEDVGMIPDFDMAVFERAINYITYKASNNRSRFAVNVSGQSIQDPEFFARMIDMADKHKEVCSRILVEITESTTIHDLDLVSTHVTKLQERGFKCCLDDFGAGSASFQYLHKLSVDYVKIDGVYIKKLLTDKRDFSMVKNLTQMCKDLDVKVIAEFVETREHAEKLRDIGVDYGQGYYFSKPIGQPDYKPRK